jgi:hypothetical protein
MKKLWQILVPVSDQFGDDYPIEKHRVWDTRVREIAGGLTILKTGKGHWITPYGDLEIEKMIPVLISCTQEEIEKIADYTAGYYGQQAIMYWLVSEQVFVKHYR